MRKMWTTLIYSGESFDSYQASWKGQIRSIDRWIVDKNGQDRFIKGRVLKPRFDISRKYYFCECVNSEGKRTTIYVHKAVFDSFSTERKTYVSHKDGDTTNNTLKNLYAVTHSELQVRNMRDYPENKIRLSKANYKSGYYKSMKTSEEKILKIKKLNALNVPVKRIAEKVGLSLSNTYKYLS